MALKEYVEEEIEDELQVNIEGTEDLQFVRHYDEPSNDVIIEDVDEDEFEDDEDEIDDVEEFDFTDSIVDELGDDDLSDFDDGEYVISLYDDNNEKTGEDIIRIGEYKTTKTEYKIEKKFTQYVRK